jgi:hypothetical protein
LSLPKEFLTLDTPSNKIKRVMKQIYKILKVILFIAILILTFNVSEKASSYILNLTFEQLSRIINVGLVIAIVLICKRK